LAITLRTQEMAGRIGLAAAAGGLAHMLYVVRVGGDFMHARLLLPGLFALCSGVAVVPFRLESAAKTWTVRALALVTCAWAALCAASLRVSPENEHGIGDERGWHARMAKLPNPYRIEHYQRFFFHSLAVDKKREIESACPSYGGAHGGEPCQRLAYLNTGGAGQLSDRKDKLPLAKETVPASVVAVVACHPLGIAGVVYGLSVNLADAYGLAEPFAARLLLAARRRPGHEKSLKTFWFAARYAADGTTSDRKVAAAKRVLACSRIRDLDAATREPMSLSRFARNVLLAFPLQALRVPEDPFVAERELCPRDSP
jgi:arabinofuranosyltransferase